MGLWEIYATAALVILSLMTALWIISLILRNASIVDIFWGAGFVVANWLYFALTPAGFSTRKWLIGALVTIWGLRLSLHILQRNWGKPEDFRYRKWREEAGKKWWWQSFFKAFLLQGLLLWIISAPLLAAQISAVPDRLTVLDIAAIPLWAIGFFFEAMGDWQLARFKADPANRGKVLQTGVWRYTRHPNYFGDAAQWWSYYLIAAVAGGYWTFFSPIIMTGLLVHISGVALLEKSLTETKPGYREYIETTSAFIPWFPHKKRGGQNEVD
jgi:steroid 5-alpha reductase family enzyme